MATDLNVELFGSTSVFEEVDVVESDFREFGFVAAVGLMIVVGAE